MASAIIGGLIQQGHPASQIDVVEPWADARAALRNNHGIDALAQAGPALQRARIVVWAVKPQTFKDAAAQAKAHTQDALHLSVAAGIRSDSIAQWLGSERIVRTMPNTPLTVGSGVVGVAPAEGATAEQARAVEALFSGSGIVVPVSEEQLPAVVAAAGSAPAYVFLLAEAITAHARQMGLDGAAAEAMAAATVKGVGLMLERGVESGERTAEQLRRAVMSPNGTTERAIAAFQDGGFEALVARAMDAAADRDRQMGRELAG